MVLAANILFVTFLKIFLESTTRSGMLLFAPLLIGVIKASFNGVFMEINSKVCRGLHLSNRRTSKI